MLYIDHLSNLCLECDPQFLQEIQLYLSIKKRRRETSGITKHQSINTRAGQINICYSALPDSLPLARMSICDYLSTGDDCEHEPLPNYNVMS